MANYTILLIDYEPRSIERFRDPLIGAGYSVELATDGVAGMEAFHRLNPDMVLVEAMIPKKHGFEVCQELKRTPHGRRTPIIITTGVYKGRKYRAQALHVYGCDEYIEKPIAPAQLLEIVGRFLAPGVSGPSAEGAHPPKVSPESVDRPIARENVDAIAKPGPSVMNDDSENGDDEITSRIDAIFSGGASPLQTARPNIAAAAAVDLDPFAQMRAEIDDELGSNSTPLAFEAAPKLEPIFEPFVSDQMEAPSVLEVLPVPATELPFALAPSGTPVVRAGEDEQPGQLVNRETKRRRKSKKSERQGTKRPSQIDEAAEIAPAPTAVGSLEAVIPVAVNPPVRVPEITIPRGTMVESELEATAKRRGIPVWAWAAVAVVAVVGIYFLFPHGNSSPAGPAPSPKPPTEAIATTPPAALPRASEPSRPVPDSPKPVLSVATVPVPKKRSDPAPAPDATAAASATTTIAPGALIPIDLADTMPVSLKREAPAYSAAAKQLRLSGTVIMNVLVNDRGTVDQVVLVSGVPGADLDETAMATARTWTYSPATRNGVPVKVWKSERVVFEP